VRTFDQHGIYNEPEADTRRVDASPVAQKINDWYGNFVDTAMKICNGNFVETEHFLNCSYYEYYYRVSVYKKYKEWLKENNKPTEGS